MSNPKRRGERIDKETSKDGAQDTPVVPVRDRLFTKLNHVVMTVPQFQNKLDDAQSKFYYEQKRQGIVGAPEHGPAARHNEADADGSESDGDNSRMMEEDEKKQQQGDDGVVLPLPGNASTPWEQFTVAKPFADKGSYVTMTLHQAGFTPKSHVRFAVLMQHLVLHIYNNCANFIRTYWNRWGKDKEWHGEPFRVQSLQARLHNQQPSLQVPPLADIPTLVMPPVLLIDIPLLTNMDTHLACAHLGVLFYYKDETVRHKVWSMGTQAGANVGYANLVTEKRFRDMWNECLNQIQVLDDHRKVALMNANPVPATAAVNAQTQLNEERRRWLRGSDTTDYLDLRLAVVTSLMLHVMTMTPTEIADVLLGYPEWGQLSLFLIGPDAVDPLTLRDRRLGSRDMKPMFDPTDQPSCAHFEELVEVPAKKRMRALEQYICLSDCQGIGDLSADDPKEEVYRLGKPAKAGYAGVHLEDVFHPHTATRIVFHYLGTKAVIVDRDNTAVKSTPHLLALVFNQPYQVTDDSHLRLLHTEYAETMRLFQQTRDVWLSSGSVDRDLRRYLAEPRHWDELDDMSVDEKEDMRAKETEEERERFREKWEESAQRERDTSRRHFNTLEMKYRTPPLLACYQMERDLLSLDTKVRKIRTTIREAQRMQVDTFSSTVGYLSLENLRHKRVDPVRLLPASGINCIMHLNDAEVFETGDPARFFVFGRWVDYIDKKLVNDKPDRVALWADTKQPIVERARKMVQKGAFSMKPANQSVTFMENRVAFHKEMGQIVRSDPLMRFRKTTPEGYKAYQQLVQRKLPQVLDMLTRKFLRSGTSATSAEDSSADGSEGHEDDSVMTDAQAVYQRLCYLQYTQLRNPATDEATNGCPLYLPYKPRNYLMEPNDHLLMELYETMVAQGYDLNAWPAAKALYHFFSHGYYTKKTEMPMVTSFGAPGCGKSNLMGFLRNLLATPELVGMPQTSQTDKAQFYGLSRNFGTVMRDDVAGESLLPIVPPKFRATAGAYLADALRSDKPSDDPNAATLRAYNQTAGQRSVAVVRKDGSMPDTKNQTIEKGHGELLNTNMCYLWLCPSIRSRVTPITWYKALLEDVSIRLNGMKVENEVDDSNQALSDPNAQSINAQYTMTMILWHLFANGLFNFIESTCTTAEKNALLSRTSTHGDKDTELQWETLDGAETESLSAEESSVAPPKKKGKDKDDEKKPILAALALQQQAPVAHRITAKDVQDNRIANNGIIRDLRVVIDSAAQARDTDYSGVPIYPIRNTKMTQLMENRDLARAQRHQVSAAIANVYGYGLMENGVGATHRHSILDTLPHLEKFAHITSTSYVVAAHWYNMIHDPQVHQLAFALYKFIDRVKSQGESHASAKRSRKQAEDQGEDPSVSQSFKVEGSLFIIKNYFDPEWSTQHRYMHFIHQLTEVTHVSGLFDDQSATSYPALLFNTGIMLSTGQIVPFVDPSTFQHRKGGSNQLRIHLSVLHLPFMVPELFNKVDSYLPFPKVVLTGNGVLESRGYDQSVCFPEAFLMAPRRYSGTDEIKARRLPAGSIFAKPEALNADTMSGVGDDYDRIMGLDHARGIVLPTLSCRFDDEKKDKEDQKMEVPESRTRLMQSESLAPAADEDVQMLSPVDRPSTPVHMDSSSSSSSSVVPVVSLFDEEEEEEDRKVPPEDFGKEARDWLALHSEYAQYGLVIETCTWIMTGKMKSGTSTGDLRLYKSYKALFGLDSADKAKTHLEQRKKDEKKNVMAYFDSLSPGAKEKFVNTVCDLKQATEKNLETLKFVPASIKAQPKAVMDRQAALYRHLFDITTPEEADDFRVHIEEHKRQALSTNIEEGKKKRAKLRETMTPLMPAYKLEPFVPLYEKTKNDPMFQVVEVDAKADPSTWPVVAANIVAKSPHLKSVMSESNTESMRHLLQFFKEELIVTSSQATLAEMEARLRVQTGLSDATYSAAYLPNIRESARVRYMVGYIREFLSPVMDFVEAPAATREKLVHYLKKVPQMYRRTKPDSSLRLSNVTIHGIEPLPTGEGTFTISPKVAIQYLMQMFTYFLELMRLRTEVVDQLSHSITLEAVVAEAMHLNIHHCTRALRLVTEMVYDPREWIVIKQDFQHRLKDILMETVPQTSEEYTRAASGRPLNLYVRVAQKFGTKFGKTMMIPTDLDLDLSYDVIMKEACLDTPGPFLPLAKEDGKTPFTEATFAFTQVNRPVIPVIQAAPAANDAQEQAQGGADEEEEAPRRQRGGGGAGRGRGRGRAQGRDVGGGGRHQRVHQARAQAAAASIARADSVPALSPAPAQSPMANVANRVAHLNIDEADIYDAPAGHVSIEGLPRPVPHRAVSVPALHPIGMPASPALSSSSHHGRRQPIDQPMAASPALSQGSNGNRRRHIDELLAASPLHLQEVVMSPSARIRMSPPENEQDGRLSRMSAVSESLSVMSGRIADSDPNKLVRTAFWNFRNKQASGADWLPAHLDTLQRIIERAQEVRASLTEQNQQYLRNLEGFVESRGAPPS